MPDQHALPGDLQRLLKRQALEVNSTSFDRDVRVLVSAIYSGSGKPRQVGYTTHKAPTFLWARLAAVFISVTLLVILVYVVRPSTPESTTNGPGKDLAASSDSSLETPKTCLGTKIKYAKLLPYNLLYSLGAKEFPYWFRLDATNDCPSDVHLQVAFKRRAGPIMVEPEPAWQQTLPAKESLSATIKPPVTFTRADFLQAGPVKLKIGVSVKDSESKLLGSQESETTILPTHTVVWDLKDPDQNPVDRKYILASLAAWTNVDSREIHEIARECRGASGSQSSRDVNRWMERCYVQLFGQDGPIKVLGESPSLLNPNERENIWPPDRVLSSREATPLEAILILAAMGRSVDEEFSNRLGMLAISEQGTGEEKLYLLWRGKGTNWQAIDADLIAGQGFAQNLQIGTTALDTVITNHPAVLDNITQGDGVHLDEENRLIAVDYRQASSRFQIGGLP